MAIIDDLINQVADKTFREHLRYEAARLNKQKKFGHVFEEHIPECTPLFEINKLWLKNNYEVCNNER